MSANSIISCGTDILLALFAVYLFFYYFDIFLIRKKEGIDRHGNGGVCYMAD